MLNIKVIQILSGFNRKELLKFRKFISSSYFNTNKNIIKLFNSLTKFHPKFDSKSFTKEKIFFSIYGKVKYDDVKLRKLSSDLFKLAEKFLIIDQMENDKSHSYEILLEEYNSRKLDQLFHVKYREAEAFLESNPYHYVNFQRHHTLKWINVSFHLSRGEQHKISSEVYERTEKLIFFVLADLFLSINDIKANREKFNYMHPTDLPEKFISCLDIKTLFEYIENNDMKDKNVMMFYYHAYMMNTNFSDDNYFFKFKKLIEENAVKFSKGGLLTMLGFLINHCIRKIRKAGDSNYEKIIIEVYELFLKYKLHKQDNYFRSDIFMLMFNGYLNIRDISKAESFLEENIRSVNPAQSKNLLSLCRALIFFEKGKFESSQEIASKIKTNTLLIKLHLRKLLMKLNYELNEFDENKEAVNNFRQFILNNKIINEDNKNKFLRFIGYYNDLIRLKIEKENDFLRDKLKKNVDEDNVVLDRGWLTEKISRS